MPTLISTSSLSTPPGSTSSGPMDRASRILLLDALSPASASAHALARLSALAQSIIEASCIGDDDEDAPAVAGDEPILNAQEGSRIPWSISNRYYSARVHFAPRHIPLLSGSVASSIPPRSRGALAAREVSRPDTGDADEELRARTRDIFATLASSSTLLGGVGNSARGTEAASRASELITKELEEVEAVVLVVDRALPLSSHQALLSTPPVASSRESISPEGSPTLLDASSFSVAIVIALPGSAPPLVASNHSEVTSLRSLYLEYGWEYIDLGAETELELHDDEEGNEQLDTDQEDDGEGLVRVKGALQAHVWPGLIRKDERRRPAQQAQEHSQTRLAADLSAAGGFSQWRATDDEDEDEEGALTGDLDSEAERRAAALLNSLGPLPSTDDVEPSAQDEALAKAFLAHLDSLQGSGPSMDQAAQLESFLARTDPAWLSSSPFTQAPPPPSSSSSAFDDDFADFVSAPNASATAALTNLDFDSALRDAEDPTLDFEVAFKNIHAEAARVRAIADPERRRNEAERVALAFGAALGE